MNFEGFSPSSEQACAIVARGFAYFPPEMMASFREAYGLSLTMQELFLCQRYYRMSARREPTVAELQFLAAHTRLWQKMPAAYRPDAISFSEDEDMRVWRDVCRMQKATEKAKSLPPSPIDALGASTAYMNRAGKQPHDPFLRAAYGTEVSALVGRIDALLLQQGDLALLCAGKAEPTKEETMLMLHAPMGRDKYTFWRDTAVFFKHFAALALTPIATTSDEGILPHLVASCRGLYLEVARLPEYDYDKGLASLAGAGRNAVLFLCRPQDLQQLLSYEGIPPLAIGRLEEKDTWTLQTDALTPPTVLNSSLLRRLRTPQRRPVTVVRKRDEQAQTAKANCRLVGDRVVSALTVEQNALPSLLTMLGEAVAMGADSEKITLATVLEAPAMGEDGADVGEIFPPVLDLHRFTAEFALPQSTTRQILHEGLTAPRLHIFLSAKRRTARGEEFLTAFASAANARDFAAMRKILKGNSSQNDF